MAKKVQKEMKSKKVKNDEAMENEQSDSKIFAFLAVFLSIIGFIIALVAKRKDKYVMFYAKQSLVLFIASIIVWIITMVLAFIPILGWFIGVLLELVILVLWLIGWIYALSGEEKEIPVVGKYATKINL